MRRDYYAVLGVVSTAELREVRQAYRRLARQYSPDVNFWDARARDLFGEIEEAYRVLSDPAARAMYDQFGHALRDGAALAAGRRGEDVHVTVQLAFADVVRGTSLRLEVPRFSPCAKCGATGVVGDARCPSCGGRGGRLRAGRRGEDVHVTVQLAFADVVRGTSLRLEVPRFSPCAKCGATGVVGDARCPSCGGRGVRRAVDPVSVTIPAGVDSGSQIRVRGEG